MKSGSKKRKSRIGAEVGNLHKSYKADASFPAQAQPARGELSLCQSLAKKTLKIRSVRCRQELDATEEGWTRGQSSFKITTGGRKASLK